MSAASFIARMQRRQADLFDGECVITRPDTSPVFNPSDGSYTATHVEVYDGRCLARPAVGSARPIAGEERADLLRYIVKVPVDTAVELGDTVEITASTHDAGLVGLTGVVITATPDEWQISRRLVVEQQG